MAVELQFADTFSEWRDKINSLVTEFNQNIIDQSEVGYFGYDEEFTSGLSIKIKGGKVRDGSVVEDVPEAVFSLDASETSIVAIYKEKNEIPELQVYTAALLPEENMIPVAMFITDGTSVLAYEDLRTMFNTGAGGAGGAAGYVDKGMLMFNALIEEDVEVPTGQHALSVSPIVDVDVTVTVSDGSEWVVL